MSRRPRESALGRYQTVVVGRPGLGALLRYELLTGLLGPMPGAFGVLLRSRAYRSMLGSAGRRLVIGRSVSLRGPGRIHLEDGVALDEYVELGTRGEGSAIRIGRDTLVGRGTIIHARDGTVEIGPESSIGTNCRVGTTSRVRIGRYALFAAGCYIGGEDHPTDDLSAPMVKQPAVSKGGVIIGDDVWLGFRATVLDGVTIGRGAIVGAHSLVTSDVPELAIAVGAPARIVRYRGAEGTAPARMEQ